MADALNKMTDDLRVQKGEFLSRESYVSSILNTTGESIIVINAKGLIERFNHAAEEVFGYQTKDAIGKNIQYP